MDLNDVEIFYLRRWLNAEIKQMCNGLEPEAKDYEAIKDKALAEIAYRIWEKNGNLQNNDMAEEIWNFIRYAWISTVVEATQPNQG